MRDIVERAVEISVVNPLHILQIRSKQLLHLSKLEELKLKVKDLLLLITYTGGHNFLYIYFIELQVLNMSKIIHVMFSNYVYKYDVNICRYFWHK